MTKKTKVILTLLFLIVYIYTITQSVDNFSSDLILLITLASTFFVAFFFAWVAPKTFFNLCWKITKYMPYRFDYNTAYRKLESLSIGLLITSILLLIIGLLII